MPVLPEVGSISVVLPGVILPWASSALDHRHADAVLDRGDRVEELQLGQQVGLDAVLLGQLVEADDRRVADGVGDRRVDAAAAWLAGVGHGALPWYFLAENRIKHGTRPECVCPTDGHEVGIKISANGFWQNAAQCHPQDACRCSHGETLMDASNAVVLPGQCRNCGHLDPFTLL